MSGILRLESLTKGNTLKQGDKTPLKYRLFDADGEKLNITGKSAKVRLVYPDFLTIGYEKDGLTVAQDDTVTFTIDNVIPPRMYHVEIIVDDKFIFPSRADETKFTIDNSSLGTEANIIEIVGVDAVVRKAVDLINDDPSLIIDADKLVGDGSLTTSKYANNSVTSDKVASDIAIKPKISNGVKNAEVINASDWLTQLSSMTVNGDTITMTPTARFGQVYQEFHAKSGHLYYVKVDISTTSNQVQLAVYRNAAASFSANASGSGVFEKVSFIFESPVDTDRYPYRFRVLDNRTSDWTPTMVKKPIWVDLTEAFGKGNEPTVEDFEHMLIGKHEQVFFQGEEVLDYVMAKGVYPLSGSASAKPIYINYFNEILNVTTKYSADKDLRIKMQKKGPNSLFDFSEMFFINNEYKTTSNDINGASAFYTSTSDWFGPYRVKAVNNIDGDSIGTNYFTGGNHSYENTTSGIATARNTSLKFFVEGREVTSYQGYANYIEVRWSNRVQANNTTKADGNGREVLEERYTLTFDGLRWNVKNEIEPLEDVSVDVYYGLQAQIGIWSNRIRFEGATNRAWITDVRSYANSQSMTTSAINLNGANGDCLEIGMDKRVDLGSLNFTNSTFDSFLTNSKVYWNLIRGEQALVANNVYAFEGYYRFYKA